MTGDHEEPEEELPPGVFARLRLWPSPGETWLEPADDDADEPEREDE